MISIDQPEVKIVRGPSRGNEMINLLRTLGMLTLALGLVFGMPWRAAADDDDPPGRAARLAYTHGSVSFEPAGTDDWVSAVVNRPVTTGDRLWTDKGARAELQMGSAAIRLAGETGFSFLNLTDNMVQVRLAEGVISMHLRHLDQDETVEVDTPNLAFTLLRPGDYRLEVNKAGDTTVVSVRGGEGEVTGGGQAFTIHSNQIATFSGTDQFASDVDRVGDRDDFDRWCRDRDNHEEHASSVRYVSRDVIGYEDLDDYGDWRTVPDYGPIWVPRRVDAGWAPYRYGHWVWISPWGWTWVDDAPWGFAPFHYGRWAFVGGAWGWCPGPVVVARPVYAPALVAWVGGPHVGIGIGSGVGWFPLGPREVYVPPYRVSRTYVTNVNVTNTTVNNTYVTNVYNNYTTNNTSVTNIRYMNRTAPGAVTATSQTAFASGQPVHRNIVKVDERQVAQTQVTANAGVVPQQRSVVGAAAKARAKPPATVQTRAVVAKTTPPPAPTAFARQQEAIQANGGRPLGRPEVQRLEPQGTRTAAAVRVVQPATKPVPVETVARTKPGQPGQPKPPERSAQAASSQPAQQTSQPQQNQRIRQDRPPSAQPNRTQPPSNPNENRLSNANPNHPDRPLQNSRDAEFDRKHQQEQQKIRQQQEQQRQRLEQKHEQQMQRAQQQAENERQQQEHQRLQQKQGQQIQKLAQKEQQQRQKVQEQQKSREDRPPRH
jgi:hypothetical protein